MKKLVYKKLRLRIVAITLAVAITPLVVLGWMIYSQFVNVSKQRIEYQIRQMARSQSNAIDVFLKERVNNLSTMVNTLSFEKLQRQVELSHLFQVLSHRTDGLGLVDLGVIDDTGQHLAYAGPFKLEGLNYYSEPWFGEVMSKGEFISDVYMGFRQLPHFIVAVRGRSGNKNWILRATIDSDVFNSLVRTGQTGRSGDAFIINKQGVFETQPRFHGMILEKSDLDPRQFGEGTTVVRHVDKDGKKKFYAGAWLKNNNWLLIISEETCRGMGGLLMSRNMEILIIVLGCFGIILTTLLTTHMIVRRLEDSDREMSVLNAQLVQTDKLAALGKMATGIAHEINNPLAVIGEKAGWMMDLLSEEEFQHSENLQEYVASVEKIEEHVERARKITHNMLGFARRMEPHLDDVDINSVLEQTLSLLENHARDNNISIHKKLMPDLPVVASDQAQLQQVFLNLINNAVDAIGKDGLVEITTFLKNQDVVIKIRDDGPGIPKEYQKKIFDPFFTTKATGKGTGLGLSISFNIIEKLGGSIVFGEAKQGGAVFTIKLPLVLPEKK